MDLHGSQYAYPILESIHVWALCLFLGMTVTLDLRLAGIALRRVPVSEMVRRFDNREEHHRATYGGADPGVLQPLE